jgi:hypothetical protein
MDGTKRFRGLKERLDPPPEAFKEFQEELWRIAALMLEFQHRPLHIAPPSREALDHDIRSQERYFDLDLSGLVLDACRCLLRDWYHTWRAVLELRLTKVFGSVL